MPSRPRVRQLVPAMLVATIVLAACGGAPSSPSPSDRAAEGAAATLEPGGTFVPFEPISYPDGTDAPCHEDRPPDADHGPYRGNLRRLSATDATTVVFELCEPDVAFLARIASPSFAINDSGWLEAFIDPARDGEQEIVRRANGTGPFRLEAWNRGADIALLRNEDYREGPVPLERLVIRWASASAQRLVELRNQTVDGIDMLGPDESQVAAEDVDLQLIERPGLNLGYAGFNDRFAPFDVAKVRAAIALAIDRQAIVDRFYPAGSTAPTHTAPCALPFACSGAALPIHDPFRARALLAEAGYSEGFTTTIRFSDVVRDYMPDPFGIATEVQAQLRQELGIQAELELLPFSELVESAEAGTLDGIHLLGVRSRYPDLSQFLDPLVGFAATSEFGSIDEATAEALQRGGSTTDPTEREQAYADANAAIVERAPMVPIGHGGSTVAYRADVTGASASPLGIERFAGMLPGDRRQLVWMQATEPTGLYCADQSMIDALRVCAQIAEPLYAYSASGASVGPALAEACTPSEGLQTWTCTLRSGVRFHDGSVLDARDVVDSLALQWDTEHRWHQPGEGGFATFESLFGGFLNPPPENP